MADLDFIKVVGRLGDTVADTTSDVDEDPDIVWADSGEVWLTPLITTTKVAGATPVPATLAQSIIKVPVDSEGYISLNDRRSVYVVDLTSTKVNPRIADGKATHLVEFMNVKANGRSLNFEKFNARFAPDTVDPRTGAVDLTIIGPVGVAAGVPVIVGPRGYTTVIEPGTTTALDWDAAPTVDLSDPEIINNLSVQSIDLGLPVGKPANIWFTNGYPSDAVGLDGDMAVNIAEDTGQWDVYSKVDGHWGVALGNIKGQIGDMPIFTADATNLAPGSDAQVIAEQISEGYYSLNFMIPEGLKGDKGDKGDVGPAGLNFQGNWDDETDYVEDDAVVYDGSTWFASEDPPVGEIPSETSAYWWPMALQGSKGDKGDQGDVGAVGPTGPAGLNWRGNWASGTAYAVNDVVYRPAGSYRRLIAGTTATNPESDSTNWAPIALKGADGTGAVNTVNGVAPTSGNVDVSNLVRKNLCIATASNQWFRVASFRMTATGARVNKTLLFQGDALAAASSSNSAIVTVSIRSAQTDASILDVRVLAKSGWFSGNSFKLIHSLNPTSGDNTYELWLCISLSGVRVDMFELGDNNSTNANTTYEETPATTATTTAPSGLSLANYANADGVLGLDDIATSFSSKLDSIQSSGSGSGQLRRARNLVQTNNTSNLATTSFAFIDTPIPISGGTVSFRIEVRGKGSNAGTFNITIFGVLTGGVVTAFWTNLDNFGISAVTVYSSALGNLSFALTNPGSQWNTPFFVADAVISGGGATLAAITGWSATFKDATGYTSLGLATRVYPEGLVRGPSTSVNGNVAVFNGTDGKALADGTLTVAQLRDASNLNAGTILDARLPARIGTGLASVSDWNAAVTSGWYLGSGSANSPETGTLVGMVYRQDSNNIVQDVQGIGITTLSTNTRAWRRICSGGVWGAWFKLQPSQAEQDARYQPLDSDLTAIAALATTAFGRSLLTQADAAAARTTLGVDAALAALVDSSPETLNTLNELAAALGDDPNFSTTVMNLIGTKLAQTANLSDLTDVIAARANLSVVENVGDDAVDGGVAVWKWNADDQVWYITGAGESSVVDLNSIQISTDTRSWVMNRDVDGTLLSASEVDGATTVRTVSFTRNGSGLISSISDDLSDRTITINRAGDGKISSITKAVS